MDIKELSESICSFVNYDGRSPLTENEIALMIFGNSFQHDKHI